MRGLSGLSKGLKTPSGSGRASPPPTLLLREGELPMTSDDQEGRIEAVTEVTATLLFWLTI